MTELRFHYIKSPQHSEIKVDGAFGGPLPSGSGISVSVYTERTPIPTVVVHDMTERGDGISEIGPENLDLRESKTGVVRVVQATLHMTLPQARAVQDWLKTQIDELEKVQGVVG